MTIIVTAFALALSYTAASAEKPKLIEWCMGNGCITGGAPLAGGSADMLAWHKCRQGELNVCRRRAVEKPK